MESSLSVKTKKNDIESIPIKLKKQNSLFITFIPNIKIGKLIQNTKYPDGILVMY